MLALTIPWLLVLLTITAIVCLLKKKWKVALLLVGVALALNWWSECIPLRLCPLKTRIESNSLKVMTFNINGANDDFSDRAEAICRIIKESAPDVIFVAEYPEQNPLLLDSMLRDVFPYRSSKSFKWMHYFYSKYPMTQQRRLRDKDNYEIGAYVCSVFIGKDTIELCGCHLSSNNYTKDKEYITPDSIKNHSNLLLYLSDVNYAYERRSDEADVISEYIHNLPRSCLIMGDFNDVGGSKTIRSLESADLNDAWWKGGLGYGATIHRPLSYRIDHIMYTVGLELKYIKVLDAYGVSDHDALFAEFDY